MSPLRVLLVGGVAALAACDSPTDPAPPEIISVEVVEGEAIFRSLAVSLRAPGAVEVEYGTPGEPALAIASDGVATDHEIFVPRLRPGTEYEFSVRSLDAREGEVDSSSGTFSTGALPPDLAALDLSATGVPSGLVMLDVLPGADPDFFSGWVAVDAEGEIVWYHRSEGRAFGWDRLANGNFVVLDNGTGVHEVRPDGEVVATLPQASGERSAHHDLLVTDDDAVFVLSHDFRTIDGTEITGEGIWEWDPVSGAAERRWSSFDHLSWTDDRGPETQPSDWLHANSISVGPRGNVLVSFRFTNEVISVASDFQDLEWRIGGNDPTFTSSPEALFSGQHTATEIEPGRVLLFDNRTDGGSPEFSRALELEYDADAGTVEVAWEFRPDPDNYSWAISSAYRLENGNTLVDFGLSDGIRGSHGGVQVFEVDPEGTPVWTLEREGPEGQHFYRATPLESVAGEVIVSP